MDKLKLFFKTFFYGMSIMQMVFLAIVVIVLPIASLIFFHEFSNSLFFCVIIVLMYSISFFPTTRLLKLIWGDVVMPQWNKGDKEKKLIESVLIHWKVSRALFFVMIASPIAWYIFTQYIKNDLVYTIISMFVWASYFVGTRSDSVIKATLPLFFPAKE